MFGCVTVNTNGVSTIAAIDTYNIRGGGRQNFGDGGSVMLCGVHMCVVYICV